MKTLSIIYRLIFTRAKKDRSLDAMSVEELFETHRDLLPVLEAHMQIVRRIKDHKDKTSDMLAAVRADLDRASKGQG